MCEEITKELLISRAKQLQKSGFIKTHRSGDTGIGKTLEDILGIKENNIQGPDTGSIEVKSSRRGTDSPLTLFTKEPPKSGQIQWNTDLLKQHGYTDSKGRLALKITLKYQQPESNGLYIDKTERFITINQSNCGVCARYPRTMLNRTLQNKFPAVLYMIASTDSIDQEETFWFNEGYLLTEPNPRNILELLESGDLKVHLRMHRKDDGTIRNRGTAWRLENKKLIKNLFDSVVKVQNINTDETSDLSINSVQRQKQISDFL